MEEAGLTGVRMDPDRPGRETDPGGAVTDQAAQWLRRRDGQGGGETPGGEKREGPAVFLPAAPPAPLERGRGAQAGKQGGKMGTNTSRHISYHTPPGLFDPGRRPPGHVLDPIISSAVRSASSALERAGVPHRVLRIDGRDDVQAGHRFYGALIIPGGDSGMCGAIPYGWTAESPGHGENPGDGDRWHGFNTLRTGTGEKPGPGRAAAATVVLAWREAGLITRFEDGGDRGMDHCMDRGEPLQMDAHAGGELDRAAEGKENPEARR